MNYNHLLSNFKFDKESLLQFGFSQTDKADVLQYRFDLPNSLYVVVKISPTKLDVDVLDAIFNDKYQPFVSGHGGSAIKSEVREILENILAKCSKKVDARAKAIELMNKLFGTVPQFPWEDTPNYCTFKTERSQKWYAIIMDVPEKFLGLPTDNVVNILNLKLPPQQVSELIDHTRYFPAYHMNKKYWLTVVLNSNTDFDTLQKLLETSYGLVEK